MLRVNFSGRGLYAKGVATVAAAAAAAAAAATVVAA